MYWERDQEITLLHLVLEALDPEEHRATADEIICGLIEMELVDCDRAPVAQQAWCDEWEGLGVSRGFVTNHYKTPEEVADEEEEDDPDDAEYHMALVESS